MQETSSDPHSTAYLLLTNQQEVSFMTGTRSLILGMERIMNKKISKRHSSQYAGNNAEMLLPESEVRCINRCRLGGYLS